MTTGKEGEEPLWKAWSRYLRSRGYQPTAAGGAGAWRYIGYAISQTLLRAHERRKLGQIFATQNWGEQPEGEFIARQLRYLDSVPSHVQTLLRRDGQAAEDVYHALEEAYQEWQVGNEGSGQATLLARHLSAGLYRSEHFRTGEAIYSLFPKQARGLRLLEIAAEWEDGPETLTLERPGYYAPLGELTASQLSTGLKIPLSGHPQLDHLHLLARRFWILRPDPNSQGDFASLGRPGVGEQFLLLARRELIPDLTTLREQGLIQWSQEENWEGDWTEYHGVMVTANHWEGVTEVSRELLDALRPESGLGLSVTGGLRVPQRGAWLHCGPPTVSVATFFTEAFLTLRCGEDVLFAGNVEPNQPVELPWRGAGDYELEAEARGQGQVRLIKLLDLDELPQAPSRDLGSLSKTWQHSGRTLSLVGPELQQGEAQ
ncbi:hypothetical protein [Deinococcus piscis]|nr:hypothetical protein [Deinococcus piscis]